MAYIKCKLRCSECGTLRDSKLNTEDKDIVCPVCQRRIQNLTEEEQDEMLGVQKKQGLFGIISLVLFGLFLLLICMWMGHGKDWISGMPKEETLAMFYGAIVVGIASIVLGILGSWRRFVVEF
jgi:peptidoglycan biosynthesis protein MviN/MurJ (putative lipid II flippase)